jgi:FecR protein
VKRAIGILLLLVIVAGAVYVYLPRGNSVSAAVAATLAVLNTDITAQKGSADFAPALDGDLLATGDVVKSSTAGRAVLTFFDGSIVTVDTGSSVKVTTLNHLDNGGIQLVIEQTIGRSWASVSKLKTPDSKFEIRTPTSTAAVRGTAFETIVTLAADGTTTATFKADEGELLVTANAGGSTTVGPNTQVTIGQGQAAPATSTPIPPGPVLRVTGSAGVGFAAVAPTGATCGTAGNKTEIFGCVVNGNAITIRGPVAGRYVLMMTSTAAAPNATVKVEALRGTAVEATQTFTRAFAAGDLVRSAFTYGAATPQTVGAFEPGETVSSLCSALATGRVFSTGTLDERYSFLQTYAATNKNQPVAFVLTDTDLTEAVAKAASDGAAQGVNVKDLVITIDAAGIHPRGSVVTPIGTFAGAADVAVGPVNGKLGLHVRNLTAGPLPGVLLDQLQQAINQSATDATSGLPIVVRQVALRPGCVAIMGTTP